jgi:hypothetical protein
LRAIEPYLFLSCVLQHRFLQCYVHIINNINTLNLISKCPCIMFTSISSVSLVTKRCRRAAIFH